MRSLASYDSIIEMALGKKKASEDPAEFVARKDYKKAISLYRERISKQPKNASLRLSLGDTLLLANQQNEAIREYKEVGALYTEEGFLVKAIAIYKKILKIQPGNRDVETFLEHLAERRDIDSPKPKAVAAPAPVAAAAPAVARPSSAARAEVAPARRPAPKLPVLEIESRLFKDLAPEEFRGIVASLALRHFEEDTIIVQEGDPGNSMFIIVRGQVRVITHDSRHKEIVLADLGEGEFFGEVSLLTGRPRTATIITNLDSELLELPRKEYEKLVARHPHVKVVMEEFNQQRAYRTIEAIIQSKREK